MFSTGTMTSVSAVAKIRPNVSVTAIGIRKLRLETGFEHQRSQPGDGGERRQQDRTESKSRSLNTGFELAHPVGDPTVDEIDQHE